MSLKDILICVYNYLPKEVVSDENYTGLWNDVIARITSSSFTVGSIGLREDIYDVVVRVYPEIANSLMPRTDKTIKFMIVSGGAITFDLDYNMNLLIQDTGFNKETLIEYSMGRLVRTSTATDDEGYYIDFSCDIKYFDEEEQDPDLLEEEKDDIFSQKFCIPMAVARLFRTNFKRFGKEITRMQAKTNMIAEDNDLSDEEKFLFSKPFLLKDLRDVIIYESKRKIIEELRELGFDVADEYGVQKPNAINAIVQNLVNQIGGDSEVVISDNIFQHFAFILDNVISNEVLTIGMIIKKENGTFTLYLAQIENDTISLMPQVLGEKDIEVLFNKSSKNVDVEGLKEFFGLDLKR